MTPSDRTKLIGILGRLSSDFDGERAAAGLLATRLLSKAGTTWDAIIPPAIEYDHTQDDRPWARQSAGSQPWRDDLAFCLQHLDTLTLWEKTFLTSLRKRDGLTPKQRACLDRIAQAIREHGL